MKKVKTLFINMLWLTVTSLVIRVIGVFFQVYLSNKIGAEGIGLFTLIMSVYMLFSTLAFSGIRLTTTRLISEELGIKCASGARRALRRCTLYSAFFGTLAMVLLLTNARAIGIFWIANEKAVLSLKLLALSLPFISLSAVFSGYFTAIRKAARCAFSQIIEQLVRIAVIVFLFILVAPRGLELACAAVVIGGVLSEFSSFLFLFFSYLKTRKKAALFKSKGGSITKRLLRIALPVAISSYVRMALNTLEHMLIPRALTASGQSGEMALRSYGTVHGMVFPVILLPSSALYALADLLVPELSESVARGEKVHQNYIVSRVLNISMIFIVAVMGILFFFAEELGKNIYAQVDISYYLRIFAPLIIVMYTDIIIDGVLKGLGEQLACMKVNIIDSLISVILTVLLVPKFGISGYLFVIMAAELVNCALGIMRLYKVTEFRFNIKFILGLLLSFSAAAIIARTALSALKILPCGGLFLALLLILISTVLYLVFCLFLGIISGADINWLKKIFHK